MTHYRDDVIYTKCPGCGLLLPEDDFQGQIAHMSEAHPEIVSERLEQAGYAWIGNRWVDLLLDE